MTRMGARTLAKQIAKYLSGGVADSPYFPSRTDMAELRAQYGVS